MGYREFSRRPRPDRQVRGESRRAQFNPLTSYHPNTHHPRLLAKLRVVLFDILGRDYVRARVDRDRANAVLDLLVHDHDRVETLEIGVLAETESDVLLTEPIDLSRGEIGAARQQLPLQIVVLDELGDDVAVVIDSSDH